MRYLLFTLLAIVIFGCTKAANPVSTVQNTGTLSENDTAWSIDSVGIYPVTIQTAGRPDTKNLAVYYHNGTQWFEFVSQSLAPDTGIFIIGIPYQKYNFWAFYSSPNSGMESATGSVHLTSVYHGSFTITMQDSSRFVGTF